MLQRSPPIANHSWLLKAIKKPFIISKEIYQIAIVSVQNDDGFFCSQACKKFSCPLTLAVK